MTLCSFLTVAVSCATSLPIASVGRHLLVVDATGNVVRYALQPATLPLVVPPGVADLVGDVASNIPGTPLGVGSPVFSVVDAGTKPLEVYTLRLATGQALRVQVSATPPDAAVVLLPPGAAPCAGRPNWSAETVLCHAGIVASPCDQIFPIAAGGVYTLLVEGEAPGVQSTLQATAK